jgi:hypothetical protein
MEGKIIKTGNRALFPLCEPLFGCEILDKGEMRPATHVRKTRFFTSSVGQSCRSALNLGGAAAPPYRRHEEFYPAPRYKLN